jgi:hypothetical protein
MLLQQKLGMKRQKLMLAHPQAAIVYKILALIGVNPSKNSTWKVGAKLRWMPNSTRSKISLNDFI